MRWYLLVTDTVGPMLQTLTTCATNDQKDFSSTFSTDADVVLLTAAGFLSSSDILPGVDDRHHMPDAIPSALFGEYRVLARVGQGGMAEIYRAEAVDQQNEIRTAILKLLRPEVSDEFVEMFDFEADIMGLLDHPNLVARLEVGRVGSRRYLAMEDVFGGDLKTLLQAHQAAQGVVPLPVALRIVVETLHGLASFHLARTRQGVALGLIHSDVNPANIFLSVDGDVKLGDFGVASATRMDAAGADLVNGVTVGKVHYLSPEQAAGEPATQASDLFSLGVVLYELALGYRPFDAPDTRALLDLIYLAKVGLPDALEPDLQHILRRSLTRNARDRYATAGEMCGDLVRFMLNHDLQCTRDELRDHIAIMLGVVA